LDCYWDTETQRKIQWFSDSVAFFCSQLL